MYKKAFTATNRRTVVRITIIFSQPQLPCYKLYDQRILVGMANIDRLCNRNNDSYQNIINQYSYEFTITHFT